MTNIGKSIVKCFLELLDFRVKDFSASFTFLKRNGTADFRILLVDRSNKIHEFFGTWSFGGCKLLNIGMAFSAHPDKTPCLAPITYAQNIAAEDVALDITRLLMEEMINEEKAEITSRKLILSRLQAQVEKAGLVPNKK
ncbi:MAG: hypothetical protein PHT51_00990 [Patescibacteria group bacterium]|nr:hypothetical protein [Patescibacteria group bacterium]MDD4610564.1 hypothetical protein [Patescibacteria group bacterium]